MSVFIRYFHLCKSLNFKASFESQFHNVVKPRILENNDFMKQIHFVTDVPLAKVLG